MTCPACKSERTKVSYTVREKGEVTEIVYVCKECKASWRKKEEK